MRCRIMSTSVQFLHALLLIVPALAAPEGFPESGNGLWYTQPGNVWASEWLPVGNGYLGATVPGGTSEETTQLNIESLWSGGPFADPSYNGGNKQPDEQAATAQLMQQYRAAIFQSPQGDIDNIDGLQTAVGQYGSYAGAGHLVSMVNVSGPVSNYARWLDMDQALARTSWTQDGLDLQRTTFCSNPTRACVEHITTSNLQPLPTITYQISVASESGLPIPNATCLSHNSMLVNGFVSTPGMTYALVFTAFSSNDTEIQCVQQPVPYGYPPSVALHIPQSSQEEAWVTWIGDTEYDMDAGDNAHNFSFRGTDPVEKLTQSLEPQSLSNYTELLEEHTADIKSVLATSFSLDLGQSPDLSQPTDVLRSKYTVDGPASTNAYLDWLAFNFGRYLLASSSRGVLPANLQGKWGNDLNNPWGADYHSNINLQMNYWIAETTGLSDLTLPLFNYIEKTWAPRGAYTAQVLYNITKGWVTHDEMNIFGHTGMKANGFTNATDYPESAVWMMIHAWDHFDYTNNITWWKAQGWPLLKGVASFHLEKLIPDLHFNDSTLVVNPCNSPEQNPVSFGCAHAQQIIWQLFNAVEKGYAASGDNDPEFLSSVLAKRAQMDKGLQIGSWGQLQEWKVDRDSPTDTHRHLSHLVGLYPGYAITHFDPVLQGTGPAKGYTRSQILNAATTSLIHRGNGTGPDADSGWEKSWRAAAWAQLQNSSMFYHELSFALSENFATNLFSMYNAYDPNDQSPIFQIDANFGFPGALMNALLQAPDVADISIPLVITLLPALPAQWSTGSIRGARVRGGISVMLTWKDGKITSASLAVDVGSHIRERPVQVVYQGHTIKTFTATSGLEIKITKF